MKNNKRTRRIFSRVLHRLSRANVYRFYGANENAYKEVLAAKRDIEDYVGDCVKVAFYEREYHIQFSTYWYRDACNHYYTVSAGHGYCNDYHRTNRDEMRDLIGMCEFARDCALRRDFYDYQFFIEVADKVLYEGLTGYEYRDFSSNGNIKDIPFDVAVNLSRKLRGCLGDITDEAIAHKKAVL